MLSMPYFHPEFHSILQPHPIFWTAGPNPYEVAKSIVQCRMLSGRYRTEQLAKHWSSNKHGFCLAPMCKFVHESLEHILLWCPSYQPVRERLKNLWLGSGNPHVTHLVKSMLDGPPRHLVQFILDASVHPTTISLVQLFGDIPLKIIFHLTRSWCFAIHKERSKILGRWPWLDLHFLCIRFSGTLDQISQLLQMEIPGNYINNSVIIWVWKSLFGCS